MIKIWCGEIYSRKGSQVFFPILMKAIRNAEYKRMDNTKKFVKLERQ